LKFKIKKQGRKESPEEENEEQAHKDTGQKEKKL